MSKQSVAQTLRRYALLVSDNAAQARRMKAILRIGGLDTETVQSSGELPTVIASKSERPSIFVGAGALADAMAVAKTFPALDVFVVADEQDPQIFGTAGKVPQVMGVIGLREPGGHPRHWEMLHLARRLSAGGPPVPSATLSWGHTWQEYVLGGSGDRDGLIEQVQTFCAEFQSPRQASATAQLADELMMNAMYDAPVDDQGRERYAHSRNQPVTLESHERPTLGFGTDGNHIVLSMTDPFGRLPKAAVFGGIHRGLTTGQMDTRGGGAGLGMLLIYHAAKVLFFDVIPGRRTQVTAIVELDLSPPDFRKLPGSVHFFVHRPPG